MNEIVINWDEVKKEYKKLKVPKDLFNPLTEPLNNAKWFIELSERATGKTNNWLLIGLILNIKYGIIVQYCRETEEMTTPKFMSECMAVLLNPQYRYIEILTDGKYNYMTYKAKKWRYAKIDENGRVIEECPQHCIFVLSLDKHDIYKSSYNCPTGDLFIFDEFIGKYYRPDSFYHLCDILSTVFRKRTSPFIVMLGNNINVNSPYFNEMGIQQDIVKMNVGESKIVKSKGGTLISITFVGLKNNKEKEKYNRLFFGFNNPKLNSITGSGNWAFNLHPLIIYNDDEEIIEGGVFVEYNKNYFRLELRYNDIIGYYVNATPFKRPKNPKVIYTLNQPTKKYEKYKTGFSKFDMKIWELYKRNKFYYSSNYVGDCIEDFFKQSKFY